MDLYVDCAFLRHFLDSDWVRMLTFRDVDGEEGSVVQKEGNEVKKNGSGKGRGKERKGTGSKSRVKESDDGVDVEETETIAGRGPKQEEKKEDDGGQETAVDDSGWPLSES